MKRSILVAILLIISAPIFGQKEFGNAKDSLANQLVERHKKLNAAKLSMSGFRIQLYFGSERAKAQEIRSDFMSQFPMQGAYLVYHQPYFKVRIGDFRTRMEAQAFLKKISSTYSTAFIVTDEVKLPSFE
jgi:hypothetical protein